MKYPTRDKPERFLTIPEFNLIHRIPLYRYTDTTPLEGIKGDLSKCPKSWIKSFIYLGKISEMIRSASSGGGGLSSLEFVPCGSPSSVGWKPGENFALKIQFELFNYLQFWPFPANYSHRNNFSSFHKQLYTIKV